MASLFNKSPLSFLTDWLCKTDAPPPTTPDRKLRIAFVGNGPLTPEQQDEINGYDLVFRCNHMPSHREGDKVDYLLFGPMPYKSDHLDEVKEGFIRFSSINPRFITRDEDKKRVSAGDLDELLKGLPALQTAYDDARERGLAPSLGFHGFAHLLTHYPDAEINLYGFSWIGNNHSIAWKIEKDVITQMCEEKGWKVHPTANEKDYHHTPTRTEPMIEEPKEAPTTWRDMMRMATCCSPPKIER